jgi:hypothetical protein
MPVQLGTGFYPCGWDHALQRIHADGPNLLQHQPDWTPVERATYEVAPPSSFEPTAVNCGAGLADAAKAVRSLRL